MPQRKPMDGPIPLKGILREALRAYNLDVDLELYALWERWPEVVGPLIAQNARPTAIKRKLLLVNVSSAPWTQQLQYLKGELIEKVNRALGRVAVENIWFQIGPVQ
jgi:predicted nucleic acid-binding Zn ribbon protein